MKIENIHKITRAMDLIAVLLMLSWFVWAVMNDKSIGFLALILAGAALNTYMLIKQPAKKMTNNILSNFLKRR